MNNVRHKDRILAHEIGLCRIAQVVDQFHSQAKTHPVLAELFDGTGNWGDKRARLTYFWWVMLGGKTLRAAGFDVFPEQGRASVNCDLLGDWLALFHQVALPIIGEELTRAWMEKAERLGDRLLIFDDKQLAELAEAS
jgi:truncated hemoglobin YjbI